MINSPLEQFSVVSLLTLQLGGINISFTNVSLFMILTLGLLILVFTFSTQNATVAPNNWQTLVEQFYELVITMIQEQVGTKAQKYFPYIFTLFTFILACNVLGLIPYTCTVTSHIAVTLGLSAMTFIGINIIGLREHGLKFFNLFMPQGAPFAIAPLLILIEFVSYVFRVFSLAIRLFANMMAGHTLLKILTGFGWTMLSMGGLFFIAGFAPIVVVFGLTGLELGIAFLQAYVFTILSCIYLNDALNLH